MINYCNWKSMKILVTGHFSSDTCQACDSCLRFSLKTLNLCHQLKQLQLCDDNGEDITVTSKNSFSFVLMALSLCCCPFLCFYLSLLWWLLGWREIFWPLDRNLLLAVEYIEMAKNTCFIKEKNAVLVYIDNQEINALNRSLWWNLKRNY